MSGNMHSCRPRTSRLSQSPQQISTKKLKNTLTHADEHGLQELNMNHMEYSIGIAYRSSQHLNVNLSLQLLPVVGGGCATCIHYL
jgi:hypothetical protein